MNERLGWLDACKGFGIICVVSGHVLTMTEASKEIARLIFLFHMPLFFMISGYTFKPGSGWSYIRKRALSLLIPYLSFMLLVDALTVMRTFLLEEAPTFRDIASLAVRNVLGGNYIGADFGVFWFVTCLFIALIAYNEIETRLGTSRKLIGFAVGLCFVASLAVNLYPTVNAAPWGLANISLAICFLWAGRKLKLVRARPVVLAALAIIMIAGILAYAGTDFTFDMKKADYGPPIFGVLLALSLSALLILGFQRFGDVRYVTGPLAVFGLSSLVIMFLHQFVHYTLRAFGVSQELLIIIAALAIPFVVYRLMDKSSSLRFWFLGKRDQDSASRQGHHDPVSMDLSPADSIQKPLNDTAVND